MNNTELTLDQLKQANGGLLSAAVIFVTGLPHRQGGSVSSPSCAKPQQRCAAASAAESSAQEDVAATLSKRQQQMQQQQ